MLSKEVLTSVLEVAAAIVVAALITQTVAKSFTGYMTDVIRPGHYDFARRSH